jgi:hypothetical protein
MIPSARLVVYHVAAGGHIAADSLSFPVIPAPGKEVSSFFGFYPITLLCIFNF